MIAEKQQLVADVSHELRSPLARLRVSLELLDKEARGNPRYIHKAIQEVENLDQLINDLLDLSGLELNPHQQALERIPLQPLLRESLEAHQLLFDKHRLQLQLQWPEHKVSIQGRRDLLERALNNLLSNLLKYAPEGSVAEIGLFVRDQQVGLRVRDYGPGLSAEELASVGQPFYRPDSSRTRKTGGTGLGLAIVQRIMQLHRGQLLLQTPADGQGGLEAILIWPLQAGTARLEPAPDSNN
jgi:two-component system sensor histidine kinase CpxA